MTESPGNPQPPLAAPQLLPASPEPRPPAHAPRGDLQQLPHLRAGRSPLAGLLSPVRPLPGRRFRQTSRPASSANNPLPPHTMPHPEATPEPFRPHPSTSPPPLFSKSPHPMPRIPPRSHAPKICPGTGLRLISGVVSFWTSVPRASARHRRGIRLRSSKLSAMSWTWARCRPGRPRSRRSVAGGWPAPTGRAGRTWRCFRTTGLRYARQYPHSSRNCSGDISFYRLRN